MIAIIQFNPSDKPQENLAYVDDQILQLRKQYQRGDLLICLPEGFACFDAEREQLIEFSKQSGQFIEQICQLAKQHSVWINAGTIPIAQGNKYLAASLLIDSSGQVVAQYNKIHLFDVTVDDSKYSYQESDTTIAGNKLVVVATPFGKLGITVCYDMRFPGLFGKLRELGAEIVLVPSAFTVPTGKVHWLPLLQARAIENQLFIIASATTGIHARGRETYGHSVIIDAWGTVVKQLGATAGTIMYSPDIASLETIRKRMPVTAHNQFSYEFKYEH